MKEFTVHTLVDITETGQRRKEPGKEVAYFQQQNFTMLLQSIGMRVNPHYSSGPRNKEDDVTSYGFGTNHKGRQRVWTFKFNIEYEDGFTDTNGDKAGLLKDDLHFIPMILELEETANVDPALLDTKSPANKNTVVFASDDQ